MTNSGVGSASAAYVGGLVADARGDQLGIAPTAIGGASTSNHQQFNGAPQQTWLGGIRGTNIAERLQKGATGPRERTADFGVAVRGTCATQFRMR